MSEFYRMRDFRSGDFVIPKWKWQHGTSGIAGVPLRILSIDTYRSQLELVGGRYDGMGIYLGNGTLVRQAPSDLNSQLRLFEAIWPILSGQPEGVE